MGMRNKKRASLNARIMYSIRITESYRYGCYVKDSSLHFAHALTVPICSEEGKGKYQLSLSPNKKIRGEAASENEGKINVKNT